MAAFIPVPGVAQAKISGTIAGNPWNIIWHFRQGTVVQPWTQSNIQSLADSLFSGLQTNFKTLFTPAVFCTNVATVDLTNQTPVLGLSGAAAFQGSNTGTLTTAASAVLINFQIPQRYRGGHPRCYMPGVSSTQTTDGETVSPAVRTGYENAIVAAIQNVVNTVPPNGPAATNQCIPLFSYTVTNDPVHHKYVRTRNALIGVSTVQAYHAHNKIASQRRRMQTG